MDNFNHEAAQVLLFQPGFHEQLYTILNRYAVFRLTPRTYLLLIDINKLNKQRNLNKK